MSDRACYYCESTTDDMRPYGPGGHWVCFDCAFATPERTQQAQQAFGALLDAAESASPYGVAVIGTEDGPQIFLGDIL